MIKLENTQVTGWEAAIRGMRNPMNSWEKSDSKECLDYDYCVGCPGPCREEIMDNICTVGPNDHELMMKLAAGGPVHAKYRRMIVVYVDIIAPLYWWKEFDTYKVGTVANSCSTMHKIHMRELGLGDFSHEHLIEPMEAMLCAVIGEINKCRKLYLDTKDKKYWWQMIQLLPTSYNQRRTVMMNYEVLAGVYPMRKDHKLDEWHDFCHWIEWLPYSEIIIGEKVAE